MSRPRTINVAVRLLLALGVFLAFGPVGMAWASVNYQSVSLVDAHHGWAAGLDQSRDRIVLRVTSNGGASWKGLTSREPTEAGTFVALASRDVGVWTAGAGGFLQTGDGGKTWRQATIAGQAPAYLTAAAFATAKVGWLCGTDDPGDGTILRTVDGGVNWQVQTTVPGPRGGLTHVSCPTANSGYVLARGDLNGISDAVWTTSDGGGHWSRRLLPRVSRFNYRTDLDFPRAGRGWVIDSSGGILRTTNGGKTWRRQHSGTSRALQSVSFVNASDGWIVGVGGLILHTSDGGGQWKREASGTSKTLMCVSFADRLHGCAVGAGILLHTANGGRTWR